MGRVVTLEKSALRGARLSHSLVETIDELPYGKYRIVFEKVGYVRSLSQNKLFWMWMTELEYWSGSSRNEWHDYYCKKFLPPGTGTSKLSTEAMRHFMNQIQADALTEWNVTLPLPDDSELFSEFIEEYKFK